MPNFEPRYSQGPMIAHLLKHERSALWAPPGSGKGSAVLKALDCLALIEAPAPVLVLAPPNVAQTTWPPEAVKFDDLQNLKLQAVFGTPARREALLKQNADIVTINYELVPWLVEHYKISAKKTAWPFRTVIADEADYLKGFRLRNGGVRAQALARVAHSQVRRWHNLDGTPGLGALENLWGPMWFIDGGQRLGRTFGEFRGRFFHAVPHGPDFTDWVPNPGALEECVALMADLCLSVERPVKDEPHVIDIEVDLPPAAMKIYKAVERDFFAGLVSGDTVEAVNAGAKSAQLLQIAQGAVYVDLTEADQDAQADRDTPIKRWEALHDAKLDALASLISEIHEPLLVAYHFRPCRERLLKRFPQARLLDRNPATQAQWNRGEIPLLLAHPASAGRGLNLQDGGRSLVFYGHWWGAANRAQLIERLGPTRQAQAGHPRAVNVYNIVARHTIDTQVSKRYNYSMTALATLMQLARG